MDVARHGVEHGHAGAEQHRMDVEPDPIDEIGFEQRARQLAAAHDARCPVPLSPLSRRTNAATSSRTMFTPGSSGSVREKT